MSYCYACPGGMSNIALELGERVVNEAILPYLATACAAPCETCLGDLDGDSDVDLADLGQLLASFGMDSGGDTDGDADTDLADLGEVLASYGTVCE
jgi:hypothetical protein